MVKRAYFVLVTLFWVTMNLLLWRSEMGAGRDAGSPVPVSLVWQKMLTAPDDSALQLMGDGRRLGYCRWSPNVGEELATGKVANEEEPPEGQVRRLGGYTLDLEGNALLGEPPQRLRFSWQAEFGTNQVWRKMMLRLVLRPNIWEVRADATTETLALKLTDGDQPWERTFSFRELQRPETLFSAFGLPLGLGWLQGLLGQSPRSVGVLSLGLDWQARLDWLKVGHTQLRVYRLQARLLDKHQVTLTVSRVGEILRVELPEGLLLTNEALNW